MKKLPFLLTLIASLLAMPLLTEAKDKDKDKDKKKEQAYEKEKKAWKVTRDDVRELNVEYGRLADSTRRGDLSRRVRQDTEDIGQEVQRLNWQFERGSTDYRGISERSARLVRAINQVRQQVLAEQSPRGGFYDYRHYNRERFR